MLLTEFIKLRQQLLFCLNMRRYLALFFVFLFSAHFLTAQKEDNVWLLGGSLSQDSVFKTCKMDFSGDSLKLIYLYKNLPFDFTNTLICDSSGQLLCFSNGENVYNHENAIVENGSNFYPNSNYIQGFPGLQAFLLLPWPNHQNKIIHIYGLPKVINDNGGYVRFWYAKIDMVINGGLGKVIERDIVISPDTTVVGQITAVRHGNGRDWWVLVPRYDGDVFYRYLLTPDGLESAGSQEQPVTTMGLGQAVFSPDGQWYARFNWHGIIPDSSFSTFDLYRFDRCTGLLSDYTSKTYSFTGLDGKPGGIAFSNSSRYLYVSRWDSIFQYDLQVPDILASETVVAVYDGFTAEFGLPTRFFTLLLAPDNKIYCSVSNTNSRYLHVIENPDLPGTACNVQQHAIHLPVFNNNLLPNVPYYRLSAWKGSPCDTLGSVAVQEVEDESLGMTVYPNPAAGQVWIDLSSPAGTDCQILLLDMMGRVVETQFLPSGSTQAIISLEKCHSGIYLVRVCNGVQPITQKKLSVIR